MVHEFLFDDGSPPSPAVIKKWLDLVENCLINNKSSDYLDPDERIAVHCVAGLGRAPVLVAVALIEAGMNPLEVSINVKKRKK